MQLTKNFYLHEFSCNDGTPVPEKFMDNVQELANNLQLLRDYLKQPIGIILVCLIFSIKKRS